MDSLRHPVGRLPAAVYWRRRLVVLVALLAALALILFACSGSSGKKKSPVGISTPTGAVSTGTAGPGGTASSPNATPPASADSSAGAPSGSAGASGGPSAGSSGGQNGGQNGAAGGTNGTAAPGSCQLKLSMVSSSHDYINGEQPMFSVAIVNNGTTDCTADVSPKSLILTVYSGTDRVWSSADCGDAKQDLRAVPPGGVQQVSITWPRTRSTPGCPSGAVSAAVGTYYAQATLGTGNGTPQAASFTTSQQTFVLKTGS